MNRFALVAALMATAVTVNAQALVNDGSGTSGFRATHVKGGFFEFSFSKPAMRFAYLFNDNIRHPWLGVELGVSSQSGTAALFDGDALSPSVSFSLTYGKTNSSGEQLLEGAVLDREVKRRVFEAVSTDDWKKLEAAAEVGQKPKFAALAPRIGISVTVFDNMTPEDKELWKQHIRETAEFEFYNHPMTKVRLEQVKAQYLEDFSKGKNFLTTDTYIRGTLNRAKYKMFDPTALLANQITEEDFSGSSIVFGYSHILNGTYGIATTLGYERGNSMQFKNTVKVEKTTTTTVGSTSITEITSIDAYKGKFHELDRMPFTVDYMIFPDFGSPILLDFFSRIDLRDASHTHVLGIAFILVEPGKPTSAKASFLVYHKDGRVNVGLNAGLKF